MDNVIVEKSKRFAVRIVRLYQHLCSNKKEFVMSRQLLRSGTSIGANVSEGEYSISKKDFLNKFQIALKECSETEYWIELLRNTNYLTNREFESIHRDCAELKYMLTAITQTTKRKLESETEKKPQDLQAS